MKINTSDFIISAVGPKQYPGEGLSEIALAGRSNVGKSSFVNKFISRKNLARTSGQPGKTQTMNYYLINKEWYFVDLPGYGFAKVSHSLKEKWGKFIEEYLSKRQELQGVIHLIDIRHAPTNEDVSMYEWLQHYRIPTLVVATKCDKIARGRWFQHAKVIKEKMQIPKADPFIIFSAETGQGLEEAHEWVESRLVLDKPIE